MESLAVKYRPKIFEDVIGQSSIVKILKRQLELNEFKNCYMFCGPSGCGKTTLARIFANKINDGVGSPIEIDAASNNGVENVKNIVSEANNRSLIGKYKIYIIDECHSLTTQAWQSFLKCVEEPPTYTIFMFATTDPQKVPATIMNRCMVFNIQKISSREIRNRLEYICQQEHFTNYSETIDLISKMCKNQCRDAIALLDKVSAYDTNFSAENTRTIIGGVLYSTYFNLINSFIDDNEKKTIEIVETLYNNGVDLKIFIENLLEFIIDVLKYLLFNNLEMTNIPVSNEQDLKNSINFNDSVKYYNYVMDKVLELKNMIKFDSNVKSTIEVAFLQICRLK